MSGPAQCYYGGNHMRMITHEDDEKIPEGFACLAMDNNGWVGTNNGWPMVGQPAIYPIAQAEAISYAWGCALRDIPAKIASPEAVSEEARKWLRWPDLAAPSTTNYRKER